MIFCWFIRKNTGVMFSVSVLSAIGKLLLIVKINLVIQTSNKFCACVPQIVVLGKQVY
jgi:hypothetical protein